MKRICLVLMAALCLALSMVSVHAADDGYYLGDADASGDVEVLDATVILRYSANINVKFIDERAADVDGMGLDVVDATFIQRHMVNIPVAYPVGEFIRIKQKPTDPYELPIVYG